MTVRLSLVGVGQFNVGILYEDGQGVTQSDSEALVKRSSGTKKQLIKATPVLSIMRGFVL